MSKKEKPTKVKKEKKFGKGVKSTVAELKKVTWPSFGKVVKQTLIVLGVVVFFTVILFGIDRLLSLLFNLLLGL